MAIIQDMAGAKAVDLRGEAAKGKEGKDGRIVTDMAVVIGEKDSVEGKEDTEVMKADTATREDQAVKEIMAHTAMKITGVIPIVGMMTDHSEMKEAEADMKEVDMEKDTMRITGKTGVLNMAHAAEETSEGMRKMMTDGRIVDGAKAEVQAIEADQEEDIRAADLKEIGKEIPAETVLHTGMNMKNRHVPKEHAARIIAETADSMKMMIAPAVAVLAMEVEMIIEMTTAIPATMMMTTEAVDKF